MLHDAIVIEAHQLDHIVHVSVALDPPRSRPAPVREHRVGADAALLFEGHPVALRKEVVSGVVAMEMTDLAVAHLECKLSASTRSGRYARPRADLLSDPCACCLCLCRRHSGLLSGWSRPRYKFKCT